eukprot:scaffold59015_cov31-Tisochrysis_lutea.AAC.3
MGGALASPPLHSPAVGEEQPILLACPMACKEQAALLTHSLTHRLAPFARPGLSPVEVSAHCCQPPPPPWSTAVAALSNV